MSANELLGLVLAVGGPGGIIAGYVTWRKLRPDTNVAMITTAQGAVGIQDTLMQEKDRHLQGVERERDYWKAEALSERGENEQLRAEGDRLRDELARVEAHVAELTTQLDKVKSDLTALRNTLPSHD